MSIQLQFRRGNTAQTAVFTGAVAELTVDTDKNTVILHDGVTAGGYALARESALSANQALAQNAFNKANAAYDAANTKYNSSGGTISGNVIVTGNVTPTTDNVYSLGSASYRWKDIFVGAGTVDIDGVKLSKVSNQLVISGATDLVLSGTNLPSSTNTANNIANAFNQANLAYDAANTAFTAGGARAFDQANLAFNKANSAWDYANSAYGTANNEILTRQANVGAAVISVTSAYQANVGAGLISVTNAYQANVGVGLITVTNDYQANVGALRIDTNTANSSLAANIGAARIVDVAAGQANVGAGLITVTNAYQANVGAARIADVASAQANTGAALIAAKSYTDTANTNLKNYTDSTFLKLSGTSQTVTSNLILNGYVTISNDLTITGNVTTINTTELNVADNEVLLNSDWNSNQAPTQNAGITINRSALPNTVNVFIRWDEANKYWVLRDNTAQYIIATTANVGAGLITVTNAYQANVGAARIADRATSQANVGAGLITVTNAYQANVGQLRLDTSNANTSLAANIGAARIADVAAGQANVGAGLITVTSAYQANVGAAKIIALGRADSAFAQANLAFDAANNVAPQIQPTRDVANSAFAQANLAYAAANSKLSSSGGTISGDLAVTGNLIISGNTTTLNVSSLKVTDSIIQLATDNQTDLVDIGFIGHYANTPNNHTGLVRRYTDGRYYLFDSYTPGTEATNLIDVANTRVATLSANLVTNVITLRGLDPLDYANTIQTASQANVGTGLIVVTNAYQANVGQLRLDTSNANTSLAANIGAARIADAATSQANVGAGLITVTNAYQANVGQLRLDTSNANTSLAANIGAARIADAATSQANVGAGLITVTNAYQANVGALRIDTNTANTNLKNYTDATFLKLSATTQTVTGNLTLNGYVTIQNDLIITGNVTTINTTELNIGDNEIVLNSDWPTNTMPTQNAGITINRGGVANSPNVFIRYDENADYWVLRDNIAQYIIATTANVGAGDITVTNAYQANVGAARIADASTSQANVGAGLITVTSAYQANVGAARIADQTTAQANVGSAIAQGQANVGAGLITVTSAYQANVGAGLISAKSTSEANVGAGLITKVAKAGDTMTGTLSSSGSLIGLNLTANNILTVNTNSIYEATAVTTSTTAQVVLDSFSTTAYRSAKYLVQITSGSSYELLELTLIHDGTTVYLSQYGNIKTGATLGVFDATISAGTLSVLATPNNAVTTFKTAVTLIPT